MKTAILVLISAYFEPILPPPQPIPKGGQPNYNGETDSYPFQPPYYGGVPGAASQLQPQLPYPLPQPPSYDQVMMPIPMTQMPDDHPQQTPVAPSAPFNYVNDFQGKNL